MSLYPRVKYEMTEEDLQKILDACKPVPYIVIGGHPPSSPQENANRAWQALGEKMGFDWETVQPAPGGNRCFTAIPLETEEQKAERTKRQLEEMRQIEIAHCRAEIEKLTEKLKELEAAK